MTTETGVVLREREAGPLAIGSLRLNGLDDLARVAKVISMSGLFKDANTPEKVAVKMFFAMTMGFSPIAGLTGVDLIEGNPTPNAHFWAAAIEDSPLYDYSVLERTDERCTIVFSRWDPRAEEWRKRGEVTWTIEDAKRAKLAGKDNWTKYPRAMLWSRAMTEGGRTYCPGLFGGVRAYDPDELGGPAPMETHRMGESRELIDEFTGEVIELPVVDKHEPTTVGAPEGESEDENPDAPPPPPPKVKLVTRAQVVRMFAIAGESKIPDEKVKDVILAVAGVESSKDIPNDKYDAVIDGLAEVALGLDNDDPPEDPDSAQTLLPSEVIAKRRGAPGDA